jgi:phosphoglycerol geranylgeranyltransferase
MPSKSPFITQPSLAPTTPQPTRPWASPLPEQRTVLGLITAARNLGRPLFAVLIDPDNLTLDGCRELLQLAGEHPVDLFFVGGSLIVHNRQASLIALLKAGSSVPVVLFPSSSLHLDPQADALLFLSLISGRNPELLIGQHVTAAPLVKASGLEVMPTGYLLIDTGRPTTATYMSGTLPIPSDKPAIAATTALAGELLGLKLMYLDGGSGGQQPITPEMIAAVRETVNCPLIVGGGINSAAKVTAALQAGADVVVVGNEIERRPEFLVEAAEAVRGYKVSR